MHVPSHIQRKEIGKTYFQTTYPAEWDRACQELESAQPLLKLCYGHWKAEFVLAQVIQSIKRGKKSKATVSISRSTPPELDSTVSDLYHAPISQQSPDGSTNFQKRQRSDSDIQTPSVNMVSPASQPPTLDNMATSLPVTKKSKKENNVVEKQSSKASNKQKKPLCEYMCF